MASLPTISLGAPGIYPYPDVPLRALTGVRMDVCAFVGVAPRGPVREPLFDEHWRDDVPCVETDRPRRRTVAVAVESFDEYRAHYGAFDGPGLLPYAVASFFEQGGQRAYIARIVHDYGDPLENAKRVARADLKGVKMRSGPLILRARNEGDWGNRLRASLSFTTRPFDFEKASKSEVIIPADVALPVGSLLRLSLPGGVNVLRYITNLSESERPDKVGSVVYANFEQMTGDVPEAIEIVEATLVISEEDGREERHERLGLSFEHPRWMATVLCYESGFVYPDASWISSSLDLTTLNPATVTSLAPVELPTPFTGGEDAYDKITPEDFFDARWTLGDDEPRDGVYALAQLSDFSSLVVPDLYSPGPLVADEHILDPISLAGPTFERCVKVRGDAPKQEKLTQDLEGLRLDPRLPDDLTEISALQSRLVEFADLLRSFVVLLDVPPGLSQRQILKWRAPFNSSYAAAYHPWLKVARRDDSRDALIRIPPSAVAAGVIARQERAFGVPHGPANVIAEQVVDVTDRTSPAHHDELHQMSINVYLRERDGIRLTAARTLSRDAAYRQLSVRRLMLMLRRTLERQMQWSVFEPNNGSLRRELRQLLRAYLRQLFRQGAFRGAKDDEAFFVRCDDALNPPRVQDAGQLIVEIGVAPAEPLEFIVLRLARDGDGTLSVEE